MIFLLFGYTVLINLIFWIHDQSCKVDSTKKNSSSYRSCSDPLEFSDFKTKFDKECKQIFKGVFAKDTNNFTYVLPSTCFLKITVKASLKVLLWVLEGFGILMENLKSAVKNIKTLISRDYKSGKLKKQFSDIKKLTREETRKPKLQKVNFSTSCNLMMQY